VRLGYLVPEFPGQTHAFFWREVQALRELGAEVFLLSTRDPGPGACAHAFAQAARAETKYLFPPAWQNALGGVRARFLAGEARKYFGELGGGGVKEQLRQGVLIASALELREVARRQRLDHVHVHSCANAAHVVAVAKLLGGPSYSLTLHGDLDVYGTGHAQKFRGASFVSVVTHALGQQVSTRLGLDPSFLPVIRMGVDVKSLVPSPLRTEPPFRAVTVARLNHAKGHVYALEAVAELKKSGLPLRYDIAGTGPEEAAIRGHVARLGLESSVSLLGGLAEHQVRDLLVNANAFLLTSFGLGEAAPVSVMEAMASGRPVICSRIGGTTEMIEDGRDGLLVPQQDITAIADALRRLVSSPDLCAELGKQARARALQDFDATANARRLLHCIEAALPTG